MADFVLIHGTTQAPTGWGRLIEELVACGHRAVAVDLALAASGAVGSYAEAVQAQVPGDFAGPVIVAHSAGALVLPAAARVTGARSQVWLAAGVPDPRCSLLEEVGARAAEMFNPEWLGKDPTTDPLLAAYFLFHDCDLDTLQWALTTLRPFAARELYAKPVVLAEHIPSTYVVATQDRTIRPSWGRRQAPARLGAAVVEIDAGHCPHVSRPQELAALLERIACDL